MPPRAPRGGRGGRGGRGRGAAAASQAGRTETDDGASSQDAPQGETVASSSTAAASQDAATPAPARGAASTARAGAASRGLAGAKFLPKIVRRTQAERDAMAEQELKKQSDKEAQDARARARANRFRGGRRARGGRGDAMGARVVRGGGGGGIFEAPAYQSGLKQHIFKGAGGPSGARGFKADPTSRAQDAFSSSSRVQGRRVNADMLAPVVDLTDEAKDEEAEARKSVMPMGMLRLQHKESGVVVATTAELEAAEQANDEDSSSSDIYVADVQKDEIVDDKQVWPGAPTNRKIKIEGEDGTLEEITEIDTLAARRAALAEPESPEQKKKDVLRASGSEQRVKKRKAVPKDAEEEEAAEDLAILLDQFGIQSADTPKEGDDVDMDGTPATSTDHAEAHKKLEGHMYLFQFPPVLPPLQSHPQPRSNNPVKDEPRDDVVMMDSLAKGSTSAIDLTSDQANVKEEEGAEAGEDQDPSKADLYSQGGFLGKLIVRKSGKVELSWGGRTLEMAPGNTTQFLTTAIITEEFDQKPRPGEIAGKSYGMGQIYGKFVLAPTWAEEEEWVVDPSELP